MTDLSSLSADQLAEKVRSEYGRWREPYLAELQTRANRAEAAEKERDEARRVVDVLKRDWRRAEARLAETQAWGKQIHDALDGRPLPEHPDEAPARIAALVARLAETQKALEHLADGTWAAQEGDWLRTDEYARAALTTHPADE